MRIVREGWSFIFWELLVGIVALGSVTQAHTPVYATIFGMLSGVAFLLAGFCAYFFRDPARIIPQGANLILCPADGRILEVVPGQENGKPVTVIRIFLSVFNAHLQRSPINGTVKKITYVPGKFLDARDPKAAFENEQNHIVIDPSPIRPLSPGERELKGEGSIVVTQIAGLIARRIVCWVKEGQTVKAGEHIGLIRFGSQVDVTLPASAKIKVKAGDIVTAGDMVLAEK